MDELFTSFASSGGNPQALELRLDLCRRIRQLPICLSLIEELVIFTYLALCALLHILGLVINRCRVQA